MLTYWLLFAATALLALIYRVRPDSSSNLGLALAFIVLAVLIGIRFEVGGDWFAYTYIQEAVGMRSFGDAVTMSLSDPGYLAVNWIAHRLGGGIWLTNLFCGAIFSFGLYRLCRTQPEPWLALLVAIPYLVIVVAMGYSRQAVAIGILMAGLASFLRGGSILRFAAYVAVAALFHRSAVILFPLVALAGQRNFIVNVLVVTTFSIAFYALFLEDEVNRFVSSYILTQYSSQGALIRILMSFTAALIFFFFARRLELEEQEYRVWRNFSIASAATLLLLAVSPSSTAVDRVALYLLPLQLVILARVPDRLLEGRTGRFAVIFYALVVQYVWLNHAAHADYWLPYQFYPFFGQ